MNRANSSDDVLNQFRKFLEFMNTDSGKNLIWKGFMKAPPSIHKTKEEFYFMGCEEAFKTALNYLKDL